MQDRTPIRPFRSSSVPAWSETGWGAAGTARWWRRLWLAEHFQLDMMDSWPIKDLHWSNEVLLATVIWRKVELGIAVWARCCREPERAQSSVWNPLTLEENVIQMLKLTILELAAENEPLRRRAAEISLLGCRMCWWWRSFPALFSIDSDTLYNHQCSEKVWMKSGTIKTQFGRKLHEKTSKYNQTLEAFIHS